MDKVESIQCSVSLAVTGAWKGTSPVKLYDELGWGITKSPSLLASRYFYKIINDLIPNYTRIQIPPL